jgi:hypothetical protein
MGGSGSGGYKPSAPTSPCARLTFQATINSPKPALLTQLKVGDLLDVVLNPQGQGVILEHNTQPAGSLTGTQVAQLINCINSGFEYQAIVVQINGGQCVVRIEPK